MAALIGTSAVTGIVTWDPRTGDAASHQARQQMHLRDALLAFLEKVGTARVIQSPDAVCSSLLAMSNSTVGFNATLGSLSCGTPPGPGAVTASLSMSLVPGEVTLVAWALA